MTRLSTLVLFLLLFSNVAKADAPLKAHVQLSPMGGFDITSLQLLGRGTKAGSQYTARELKVPSMGLRTGISLRDRHLREKLEADKFPFIRVLEVKASGQRGVAKMVIRNVTKPIRFTFKDLGHGTATAHFKIHLPDYNFSGINYKGVGVADDVDVVATVPYDSK
jgi:hypothetical protein